MMRIESQSQTEPGNSIHKRMYRSARNLLQRNRPIRMTWLTKEEETVFQQRSRHKKLALLALLVGVMGCAGAQVISNAPTQEESRGNSDQAVVLRVEKLFAEAIAAIDNKDWLRANALLKEGLDAVGNRYVRPITPDFALLDDTGMALVLAFSEEKQSRLNHAAHLRKSVLSDRLWLLREKLRAEAVR